MIMRLTKPALTLFFTGTLGYASSLAVYQDYSFYTYTPQINFIGFTQNVDAKCDGSTLSLVPMLNCPTSSRLCQVLSTAESTKETLNVVTANTKVLEQFISLPQPKSINAKTWIASAKLLGKEEATLAKKKLYLSKKLQQEKMLFSKQAPSEEAKESAKSCAKNLELALPYGQVSFSTSYEANIEEKVISVTQYLHITNASGVDIQADVANFYYRSAKQYVQPIHFSPWIVSKYVPRPKRMAKSKSRRLFEEDSLPMMSMSMESAVEAPLVEPVATYEDAREYKINNLTLPSSGVPLDVKVLTWKTALECEIKAYPYANASAFEVCSFTPKYQIDDNRWKVLTGSEVINEKAIGEYREKSYDIYTKVDDDIQIEREAIVQRERETGIFGGTARKKDGFTLTLTNKSNKIKTLTIVERIPTSSTTEITSKLLSITSKKKVKYTMLKNGEIEMPITLAANESRKIEVLFELSYDKDIKVKY